MQRALCRDAYRRVLEVLPYDGDIAIRIEDWPDRAANCEASSQPDAVRIHPVAMATRFPDRPAYLLYEEIAHTIVTDMGLATSEGLAGAFFQELFAGYVKFSLARRHHPRLFDDPLKPPIPGDADHHRLFYALGTDLGAVLAGFREIEPVMDAWYEQEDVDEAGAVLREFVRMVEADLRAGIEAGWTFTQVGERCIVLHDLTVQGANEHLEAA